MPDNEASKIHKEEQIQLTPARSMMLHVLLDMVNEGEFISEFAAEKVVYFLQRFGADEQFKVEFDSNFYGPYSGKIKQVLKYLSGSYINEYDSLNNNPFQELNLSMSTQKKVDGYLNLPENKIYKDIAQKTTEFLSGFYSSLGLELLSRIDYIRQTEKIYTDQEIMAHLNLRTFEKCTVIDNPDYVTLINTHLANFFASN